MRIDKILFWRGVAQLARAPVSKTGCREFESRHPCQKIILFSLITCDDYQDLSPLPNIWKNMHISFPEKYNITPDIVEQRIRVSAGTFSACADIRNIVGDLLTRKHFELFPDETN